jgi:hypothetical protein
MSQTFESRIANLRNRREHEALLRDLGQMMETSPALGLELARSSSPEVRFYMIRHAPRYAGARGADILERAFLSDSDPDNRLEALDLLVAVDPGRAKRHLPAIRKRLHSRDFWEPELAMWTLLRLRDAASLEDVQAAAERWGEADGRGRIARIVAAGLAGDTGWIARRLLGHEHDETGWLARAAATLGGPELTDALKEAAASLPDPACRQVCSDELAGSADDDGPDLWD